MIGRSWQITLAGCAIALLAACTASRQANDVTPATGGFLPEPQLMQPGGVGEPASFSAQPGIVWYGYTKMMLEPATLWAGPYAGLATMPPGDRKTLANALYSEVHFVAEQLCEMVDKPSQGTLLVNVALVDANTSDPSLATISSATANQQLPDATQGAPFDSAAGSFVTRAMLKTVARDAMTGAVLWQTVDRRPAEALNGRLLTSSQDIDRALKSWAAKFGNWMSLLGACS